LSLDPGDRDHRAPTLVPRRRGARSLENQPSTVATIPHPEERVRQGCLVTRTRRGQRCEPWHTTTRDCGHRSTAGPSKRDLEACREGHAPAWRPVAPIARRRVVPGDRSTVDGDSERLPHGDADEAATVEPPLADERRRSAKARIGVPAIVTTWCTSTSPRSSDDHLLVAITHRAPPAPRCLHSLSMTGDRDTSLAAGAI